MDSGHLIVHSHVAQVQGPTTGQWVQPPHSCYQYNSAGKYNKFDCTFYHGCCQCAGKHPITACPKLTWPRKGSKPQDGDGKKGGTSPSTSWKGAQPQVKFVIHYSDKRDMQLLSHGFQFGFRILAPPPSAPTWARICLQLWAWRTWYGLR